MMLVDNFSIIYVVDAQEVVVTHILYSASDIKEKIKLKILKLHLITWKIFCFAQIIFNHKFSCIVKASLTISKVIG